jgi:hypothetical protein
MMAVPSIEEDGYQQISPCEFEIPQIFVAKTTMIFYYPL